MYIGTTGLGATVEKICAIFTFVTWKKTPYRSTEIKGQGVFFINWAIVNIFVYRHPGPRNNR